jgi:hypothetical protein
MLGIKVAVASKLSGDNVQAVPGEALMKTPWEAETMRRRAR